ncbi:MAG TPA: pyridoxine 5'-phosphate synthase, partial [Thermodesulfobacteriota bacterium]|nr:pyridoxine 5'-phosphate synthase [Thermodesulfobacteriota bacterium]
MPRLNVNIDHVATVRQARGGKEPDPVLAAYLAELGGAQGIVAHLREDRRHIQDRDVAMLRETVKTKLNLEMAATEEMVSIARRVRPDMSTLVPEKRQELTTEGGLDVAGNFKTVSRAVKELSKAGIFVSLFIDPDPKQIKASKETGAGMVEIHTGTYADTASDAGKDAELKKITKAVNKALSLGLR